MKKKILLIIQVIVMSCLNIKIVSASINIDYEELNIGINTKQQLKVSGDINNQMSWTSSNNNIATVDNGTVTGLSLGTTYVTVNNGASSSACKVNVISNYVPVSNIKLPESSTEILINETKNINSSIEPSNASNKKLFYYSSNLDIVTVDASGRLTGKKTGAAIITITAEDKSISYKVTVVDKIALKGISINPSSISLNEGATNKLSIDYNPNNATEKNVSWKSSDSKIVTVDETGNVKALTPGEATITATSKDGGYTSSSKITVIAIDKKLKGISLDKTELSLNVNESANLSVKFDPDYATNKDVTWSSSNSEIVTVENGKIKALKPGRAEIKATSKEGKYEAICQVKVNGLPIEEIKFQNEEQTVSVGDTIELKTIPTPEDSIIEDPIWTSSNPNVATIKNGYLTALKTGKTIISVTDKEGKISATTNITVIEKEADELKINITGYNLNFDPSTHNYTIKIGDETSLEINVNRDKDKVIIGGNQDLKNGSIITITINDKEKSKYIINIKKKQDIPIYFIIIVTMLLIVNIIRIILNSKQKSKRI